MTVNDYLKEVKANKNTYYNLSLKDKIMYQDLYNYLKRYKDKELSNTLFEYQINTINKETSYYLRKYKLMELIAFNIKH